MAATLRLRTALAVPSVPGSPSLGGGASPGAAAPQALGASASTGALVRSPSSPHVLSPVHVAHYPGTLRSVSPRPTVIVSSGSAACRAASGSASRPWAACEFSAPASATSTPGLLPGVLTPQTCGQSQTYTLHRSNSGVPPPISAPAVTVAVTTAGIGTNRPTPQVSVGVTVSTSSTPRAQTPRIAAPGHCSPGINRVSRTPTCSSISSTCHAVGHTTVHVNGQQDGHGQQARQSHVAPASSSSRSRERPSPSRASSAAADVIQGEYTGYMPPSLRTWRPPDAQPPAGLGDCRSHAPVATRQHSAPTELVRQGSDDTTASSHSDDDDSAATKYENCPSHGADNNDAMIKGSPVPGADSPRLLVRTARSVTNDATDVAAGEEDDCGRSVSHCSSPCEHTSLVLTSREPRSGEACCFQPLELPQPRLAIVAHAFSSDPGDTVQLSLRPGDVIEKLQTDPSGWTYGRLVVSPLLGVSEPTALPSGWFPESCLMPEGTSLPLSVASHLQKDAQQGCISGASTTADINSNTPNASDVSPEATLVWPVSSPGGSVSSSTGMAGRRRQKPNEAPVRTRSGLDEVTSQLHMSVDEAEHRVEMAACLLTFLDAQEKRLMAEMAVQAGCQRQASLTRLRLLRAKKAASTQALREAQARARVCRGGAAVKDHSMSATMSHHEVLATAAAATTMDAQRRHRQRTERLVERASKRALDAAETAAAAPPPTAGAHADNRKRCLSRGNSAPRLGLSRAESHTPRHAATLHSGAGDGVLPVRRTPGAVPPRTSRRAASRNVSPRSSSAAASPAMRMRSSASMSNLSGNRNSAVAPQAPSPPRSRSATSSPRSSKPALNSLMSMKLPRSLSKLLDPKVQRPCAERSTSPRCQQRSASPPGTLRPASRSPEEATRSRAKLPDSRPRMEVAAPVRLPARSQEQLCRASVMEAPQVFTTEEELRQACEALEESARAVSASERRVAELQKAWEHAIASDADGSVGVESAESRPCGVFAQLRSTRDAEADSLEILEEPHLGEYAEGAVADADGCHSVVKEQVQHFEAIQHARRGCEKIGRESEEILEEPQLSEDTKVADLVAAQRREAWKLVCAQTDTAMLGKGLAAVASQSDQDLAAFLTDCKSSRSPRKEIPVAHHPQGSDDTAQLFVDVLEMAQQLPSRWQDMSSEERLRLIGDFSRVRGLLRPHFQQGAMGEDAL